MPSPNQENSASGDKHPEGRPSNKSNLANEALLDAIVMRVEAAVRKASADFPQLAVDNSVDAIEQKLEGFKRSVNQTITNAPTQERDAFIQKVELECSSEKRTKIIAPQNESKSDELGRQVCKFLNESRSEFRKQFDKLVKEAASTGAIMNLVRQETEPVHIFSLISATALSLVRHRMSCVALFVAPLDIDAALNQYNPDQITEFSRGRAWSRQSRPTKAVSDYLKHVGTYYSRKTRAPVFADKPENYPYEMEPSCTAYVENKRLTLIPALYGETSVGALLLLTDKSFRFSNDSKSRLRLLAYESGQALAHIARIDSR